MLDATRMLAHVKCGEIKVPNAEGTAGPAGDRDAEGEQVATLVYAAWTDGRPAGAVLAVDDVHDQPACRLSSFGWREVKGGRGGIIII